MVTRQTKSKSGSSSKRTVNRSLRAPANTAVKPLKRRKGEDIHAFIIRLGNSIPQEELDRIPPDLAEQHDHYIYGTPKHN